MAIVHDAVICAIIGLLKQCLAAEGAGNADIWRVVCYIFNDVGQELPVKAFPPNGSFMLKVDTSLQKRMDGDLQLEGASHAIGLNGISPG